MDFSRLKCPFFHCSFSFPFSFRPLKKIDEENEANLLAVLTETLDSIPVDEDGLPSFEALADGDVTNASDQSCPSTPDGSPRTPEPEEPSLVRDTPPVLPVRPILFCHEAWPSHSVSFHRSFSVPKCFTFPDSLCLVFTSTR